MIERIGIDGTRFVHRGPNGEVKQELPKGGFAEAFKAMTAAMTAKDTGVISGAGEVSVSHIVWCTAARSLRKAR
jgi:hypothetical protein